MPWKERSISAWGSELSMGDTITGKLLRTEENINATPDNKLFDYILETDKGETRVWGSKFLNLQLTDRDTGKLVKITYDGLGKAKKGKNAPKQFKVQVNE